jgi:hypothetical protein
MDIIKSQYKVPKIAILGIKTEGIICNSPTGTDSGPDFNGFDEEEDWS